MTTTLLFVRHGSTQWTAPPSRSQGRTDLPLSARGRAEAEQLADRLHAIKFDAIYSSPLRRARETAVALAYGRLLPLETDDRIIELNYGDWEGKRYVGLQADEGDSLTGW